MQEPLTVHESMLQLIRGAANQHNLCGLVLVTSYAVVIPMLKVALLCVGHCLQHGRRPNIPMARRCIMLVQVVSKWASPDMFAYILVMTLYRELNRPPGLLSGMSLGVGFTCFCVGSTVSSLGIRVPDLPKTPEAPSNPRRPRCG